MKRVIRIIAVLAVLIAACACIHVPVTSTPTGAPAIPPNGGWKPAWSPDGSSIAFLSATPHTPSDLWVMASDGTAPRRLTTAGAQAFRWTGDGTTLQYSTTRKGFDEIFSISEDGSEERRVAGLPPNASIPVYSPDESLLAFTAPGETKVRDLWIGTADGSRMEAVTEKLGVRSIVWGPDSRRVYFEPGESYGVGLWSLDLATMESKVVLNNYIGTPKYSVPAGRFAYPYPVNPGEYDIHTCDPEGQDEKIYKTPRLEGLQLAWDDTGTGVYYLGRDIGGATAETPPGEQPDLPPGHMKSRAPERSEEAISSLWHLDFASGAETLASPQELHVTDFAVSPAGSAIVLAGVLQDSYGSELFRLDSGTRAWTRLAASRPSYWMAVPSLDSSKIAFFTNDSEVDTLEVVSLDGAQVATYPGVPADQGTRLYWLPDSDGLLIFSARGIHAFNEDGQIPFPNRKDHRGYLYADVSVRSDKVLLSSIPRFGEFPGLYLLEVEEGAFAQSDLRYPPEPEIAADLYLHPKWSFDESKIAFTDRIDLWVMNADGSDRRWITDFAASNARDDAGPPAVVTRPFWSVAGDWIGHTRLIYGKDSLIRELWIMRPDGSDGRKLFSEPVNSTFLLHIEDYTTGAFFDTGGGWIIYTAMDDGVPNLFRVGMKDGEVQRLTSRGALFPVLLPEEDLILYTSLAGNSESLWQMNSDGTDSRPFPAAP